ncbi:MAG: DNA-3-methyladenine glycosylase 2 family protein [Actinobacteria bacterium]|nr:DNA-3-methyladenine glycosylase 2 family protein [Actinomycetota bacterium]
METPRESSFLIEPAAPFRLDMTAWALRRRPHNAIDLWDGRVYRRALPIGEGAMAVAVTQDGAPEAPRLQVTLRGDMLGPVAAAQARQALTRLLGLEADLSGFATAAASDPALAALVARMRGLKPPRFATPFEGLVNGVACQQLSLDVGVHLLNRLTVAYGRPVDAAGSGLHAFPEPSALATVDPANLRPLGFSMAKAQTIVTAARKIVDGDLDLVRLEGAEDAEVLERLTALHGVGRWTAQYVMLRGLGRLEVFPGDDVGARNKLKAFLGLDGEFDYERVETVVSRWAPYAGLVYFHLLLDSLSRAGLVA